MANDVVPIPVQPPAEDPPSKHGRMHGSAIGGMGISALVGFAAMIAFITVTWPENIARVLIAVCVVAGIAFITFAALAVFSAARDTYRNEGNVLPHD